MAWSRDGSRLLVPDPMGGEVFVFNREGAVEQRLRRPGRGDLEFIRPGPIRPDRRGSFLQDGNLRVLTLNEDGEPIRAADFAGRLYPGSQEVRALFDWTVAGDSVYSFSDVLQPDGAWRSGWFRFTLGDASRLEPVREVAIDDPERQFYTLGSGHATAVAGRAYLLIMAPEPHILEVDGARQRRLRSFPDGFSRRPTIPRLRKVEEIPLVFAAIERTAMPVGLFEEASRLYVLTRRPGERGTVWELTGIDPAADRVVSRVRLPTAARHLVAAPGPQRWAFAEKSGIDQPGEQQVLGLLFVPTAWLAGTSGSTDPPPGCA
jgi:hypothetical protein